MGYARAHRTVSEHAAGNKTPIPLAAISIGGETLRPTKYCDRQSRNWSDDTGSIKATSVRRHHLQSAVPSPASKQNFIPLYAAGYAKQSASPAASGGRSGRSDHGAGDR